MVNIFEHVFYVILVIKHIYFFFLFSLFSCFLKTRNNFGKLYKKDPLFSENTKIIFCILKSSLIKQIL